MYAITCKASYTPKMQDPPQGQYIPHGKRNMKLCSSPVKMYYSKGHDILYVVCNIWYLVNDIWYLVKVSMCCTFEP